MNFLKWSGVGLILFFASLNTGFAETVSFQKIVPHELPLLIQKTLQLHVVDKGSPYLIRPPMVSLSAGMGHTCGVGNDQTVWCWGWNNHGQLGIGGNQDRKSPQKVVDLEKVTQVSAGGVHTCALAEGKVYCWGSNGSGQLGDGTFDDRTEPVLVPGLTDITKISSGGRHTCATNHLGELLCWGSNQDHQLGLGPDITGYEETPQVVDVPLFGVKNVDVFAGNNHTCALKNESGYVFCWGDNFHGKSGIGTENSPPSTVGSPSMVGNLIDVTKISAGGNHTCVLKTNKTVSCWGDNYKGQLGNGQSGNHHVAAVAVSGLNNVIDIVTSRGSLDNLGNVSGLAYSCALKENGSVYCWGDEDHWGIGFGDQEEWMIKAMQELGSANWNPTIPMRIFLEDDAIQLTAGETHTCALIQGGSFVCWGSNSHGELGNGTTVSQPAPS